MCKSMINVIENGINPILEKDKKDNYPKLAVKIGIDEGENSLYNMNLIKVTY